MSMDIDARIAALLRHDAPARQDPMFRLRVLKRREQQRFQRKAVLLGLAALGVVAAVGIAYGARVVLMERLNVVLLCATLIGSGVWHAPVVAYFVRRLGGTRRTRGAASAPDSRAD
jgi:hypothetical protein